MPIFPHNLNGRGNINLLYTIMALIFILGTVGAMLGFTVIIVAVFTKGGVYKYWVYFGRALVFISLGILLCEVAHCVMASNSIFGL